MTIATFAQIASTRNPHLFTVGEAMAADGSTLRIKVANMGKRNHLWVSTTGRRMRRVVQCDAAVGSERTALAAMLAAVGAELTALAPMALGTNSGEPTALRVF